MVVFIIDVVLHHLDNVSMTDLSRKPEDENIPQPQQEFYHVPHAFAACPNATFPGPGVSKYQGQADYGQPERGPETRSDQPGCMDLGEPFVVLKGHLLTQT
jgi:hypothetical protein